MNRGRKRLPTHVKRLRGTLRSDREPVDQPGNFPHREIATNVPDELAGDSIARAEWRRLAAARLTPTIDRAPLIACCLEWSRYLRASKLSRGNLTTKRGSGGVGIAPSVTVAYRALQSLLRLWPELRMTPHSRAGAAPDVPELNDKWEFDDPPPRTN